MNNVKAIFFSFAIVVLILSCTTKHPVNSTKFYYTDFPKEYHLSDPTGVNNINQLTPGKIFKVDTLFILWQYKGDEYFFGVYDNDFNHIGSFGRKGKGPGEFSMLEFCGQFEKDSLGNLKLWIHDQNLFKAFKIDLLKAMNTDGSEDFIEKIIYLPTELLTIPEVIVNEKDRVVFCRSDMISFGRYLIFKENNDLLHWLPTIPDVSEFTHEENLDLAYNSKTRFDFNNKRAISAMTFFERIDIFSSTGKIVKSIIRENGNSPPNFMDFNEPFKPENYSYYKDLQVTDKFIFASCTGISRSNALEKRRADISIKSKLQVFDINGTPLIEYFCNTEISRFTVDVKKKKLYVLNFNSEDLPILIYNLPDLF